MKRSNKVYVDPETKRVLNRNNWHQRKVIAALEYGKRTAVKGLDSWQGVHDSLVLRRELNELIGSGKELALIKPEESYRFPQVPPPHPPDWNYPDLRRRDNRQIVRTHEEFGYLINFLHQTIECEEVVEVFLDLEYTNEHCLLDEATALIQILFDNTVWLISPQVNGKGIVEKLKPLLEHPKVIIYLFNYSSDVKRLMVDYSINLHQIVDVEILAPLLVEGFKGGLKKLVVDLLGEKYPEEIEYYNSYDHVILQSSDFTQIPLDPQQEDYVTWDVWLLAIIVNILKDMAGPDRLQILWSQVASQVKKMLYFRPSGQGVKQIKGVVYKLPSFPKDIPLLVEEVKIDKMLASNRLKELGIDITHPDLIPEEIEALLKYRRWLAVTYDEKEDTIMKTDVIAKILLARPQTIDGLYRLLTQKEGRNQAHHLWGPTINKFCLLGLEYLHNLKNTECHNCCKFGHPASGCNKFYNVNQLMWYSQNPEFLIKKKKSKGEKEERQKKRKYQFQKIQQVVLSIEGILSRNEDAVREFNPSFFNVRTNLNTCMAVNERVKANKNQDHDASQMRKSVGELLHSTLAFIRRLYDDRVEYWCNNIQENISTLNDLKQHSVHLRNVINGWLKIVKPLPDPTEPRPVIEVDQIKRNPHFEAASDELRKIVQLLGDDKNDEISSNMIGFYQLVDSCKYLLKYCTIEGKVLKTKAETRKELLLNYFSISEEILDKNILQQLKLTDDQLHESLTLVTSLMQNLKIASWFNHVNPPESYKKNEKPEESFTAIVPPRVLTNWLYDLFQFKKEISSKEKNLLPLVNESIKVIQQHLVLIKVLINSKGHWLTLTLVYESFIKVYDSLLVMKEKFFSLSKNHQLYLKSEVSINQFRQFFELFLKNCLYDSPGSLADRPTTTTEEVEADWYNGKCSLDREIAKSYFRGIFIEIDQQQQQLHTLTSSSPHYENVIQKNVEDGVLFSKVLLGIQLYPDIPNHSTLGEIRKIIVSDLWTTFQEERETISAVCIKKPDLFEKFENSFKDYIFYQNIRDEERQEPTFVGFGASKPFNWRNAEWVGASSSSANRK